MILSKLVYNSTLENKVVSNFKKIHLSNLLSPFLFLLAIAIMLFKKNALNIIEYIEIQKQLFFFLNSKIVKIPNLIVNITQLGDAIIFFPLLTAFIIYAPKLWSALSISSIIAVLFSISLKRLFVVPRPAAVFDNDTFIIIGETLSSTHSSLPSGHSITIFMIITILLHAFMPKKISYKVIFSFFILSLGLIVSFTRVGVGAHFPLDVIIGSIIGYMSAIIGIMINNNVDYFNWLKNKKYYPILILLLTICMVIIITKLMTNNLLIFYLSILALLVTNYSMINIYFKKPF